MSFVALFQIFFFNTLFCRYEAESLVLGSKTCRKKSSLIIQQVKTQWTTTTIKTTHKQVSVNNLDQMLKTNTNPCNIYKRGGSQFPLLCVLEESEPEMKKFDDFFLKPQYIVFFCFFLDMRQFMRVLVLEKKSRPYY